MSTRVFEKEQRLLWTADKTISGEIWLVNLNHGWCDHQNPANSYFVRAVRSLDG